MMERADQEAHQQNLWDHIHRSTAAPVAVTPLACEAATAEALATISTSPPAILSTVTVMTAIDDGDGDWIVASKEGWLGCLRRGPRGSIEHEDLGDRMCGNKKGTRRSRTEWPTMCGKQRRWRQNWQLNPKRKSPWSAITNWDFVTAEHIEAANMGSVWLTLPSHNDAGESAASAATSHPYGTPAAGSLLPETTLGPADKGFSSLKGTACGSRSRSVLRVQAAAALVEETAGFNVEATNRDEAQVRQQLAEMKLDEVRRS